MVRRRARALGAPLAVEPAPVPDDEREQAIVDAVRLAHRDATLARALPVLLAGQWPRLEPSRLAVTAARSREKHALGFFRALRGELTNAPALQAWAETLRDHRVRARRPFFDLPITAAARAQMAVRTPAVAHAWGYLLDLDLAAFATAFAKHAA
jgi:hypothetical protein